MSDVDDYLERALALMRESLATEAQNKVAIISPTTTPEAKAMAETISVASKVAVLS